jgi:hypothetical protein
MQSGIGHAPQSHRLAMPWGLLAAVEVIAFALLSGALVLWIIPSAFEVEWACVGVTGAARSSADTYIDAFAVFGALSWLVVSGATVMAYAAGRRVLAAAIPAAWFAALTLIAVAISAAIGPLPC